ncbi:glycerophosphodiester phosphodiesterase [Priestia taiwanensis]|uniref:Glycerophosphoryl diester phosphodiesterase n=1 Tax=Priestia taiwanensis TaxID=1347902 RepID=A0A917AID8_9BACI|nr:glycerophosphodiester phosphodiesterase [Priestia taiwanensis]MBM7361415.1 glycerophosphoryl diester phosphodiesterase [Priestia taiwanensis]GGE53962.1 glycerophosphoryl diester phosphodiesterase [Priestia taiwanensis]
MVQVFAHRGAAGTYPENTMVAFKKAKRLGADGLELDVQLTKDDQLVVIHDETLDRTTDGRGFVHDYTYEELRRYNANYKFGAKIDFCEIPLLEDVFKWCKDNTLKINIELKNNFIPYYGMEEEVISLIRSHRLSKRVILSSFNDESLVKCKQIAPSIETAILYNTRIMHPWYYAEHLGVDAIHPSYRLIDRYIVEECKKRNIAVRPYTINNVPLMKQIIEDGCDAIITDYPERAKSLLKK